jgi:thioesterase domain-containing protein
MTQHNSNANAATGGSPGVPLPTVTLPIIATSFAAVPFLEVPMIAFRATGSGSPLFCFPGSGGDADIFEHVVAVLPEGQPVYAIDMEPLCDVKQELTIEQLAPIYLAAIRKIQPSGPYYFCGYSFGGLVAYEIASRLLDVGDSACLVALLDAANPAMLSNLSQTDVAQFHKTYLADRLKRYAVQLMKGELKAFAARGFAFVVSRLGKYLTPVIKKGFRMAKRPLPEILRSNDPVFLNAWRAYVPKPYAKDLVIFRVQDRGPEYDRDLTMGWDACVTGGVQVHVVPGDHVGMMSMPSAGFIAATLATYLDDGSSRIGAVVTV